MKAFHFSLYSISDLQPEVYMMMAVSVGSGGEGEIEELEPREMTSDILWNATMSVGGGAGMDLWSGMVTTAMLCLKAATADTIQSAQVLAYNTILSLGLTPNSLSPLPNWSALVFKSV